MNENPSKEAVNLPAELPPPIPQAETFSKPHIASEIQPANFYALKAFLIFHIVMTGVFFIGHIFKGLPETLQGSSFRDFNLELIRIVTSGAHLTCLVGIFKLKIWAWRGYKIIWFLSLVLHLMVASLDLIGLILFASIFTGIIYILLNSGGANCAMKRLN